MSDNETLADILAEMRLGSTRGLPCAYRIGRPNPTGPIKIDNVTIGELADRIEAAYARDIGNAAALREAGDHSPTDYPQMVLDTVSTALDWLPRNCDRFSTLAAATDAWRVENRTWQWDDGDTPANYMKARASQDVGEFLDWLFAPAEGGAE